MTHRELFLLLVACGTLMWRPSAGAQDVLWVVETAAPDIPTDVRTPFALDTRERRPTAEPGPPARQDDAGCARLPNGFLVCPPPGLALRGRRTRPASDSVAYQDAPPPPPADAPPPPMWPLPKRAPTPYASPQYAPPPQAQASPQYAPYASSQAITGFTLDEIDRFSVERRHYARPRAAPRWAEGYPPQTYAAATQEFAAAPMSCTAPCASQFPAFPEDVSCSQLRSCSSPWASCPRMP